MDNNEAGVTSFCDCTIKIHAIECKDWSFNTTNFHPFITELTISAWVDICSNSNVIPYFEVTNIWPNFFDYSNDLMPLHTQK